MSEAANPNAKPLPEVNPQAFDLSGRTLGEFQIIRRLGKGGMAEVYLAEQTSLKRQVAIKVLRAEYLADAAYVKRFRHEATAAGGLNHPNIVQVYSIGEHDGIHFIAQEYVRGGNLKEFLKKKGPLDVNLAIFLMKQVAAALQVAGSNGIVHRDIKPENILLTKKGEAKVADFGLAQLTQGGERVALTQVGVTMGTPLYMSPEQVGGKPVDHRSDIYSFGAMAYHMLTGRPPFQGDTALAVAVKHLNDKPEPLKSIRPDLPPQVCDLVQKMMAKRREDRYPDALAVFNALKVLQKQLSGKDDGEITTTVRVRSRRGWSPDLFSGRALRRQWTNLAIAGALVACAGAGIGWTQRVGNPFVEAAPQAAAVPQQASIEAQYFYAMRTGDDEAAWRAVVDYPADQNGRRDEMARDIAELRLAIIFLSQDRLDEAQQIFDRFRQAGSTNPWKQAHGLAGQAILQSIRGETSASNGTIDLLDRSSSSLDAKLKPLLDEARQRNHGPRGG